MRRLAERGGRTTALALAGLLATTALASAALASADPAKPTVIAWSTFLRNGPGETYAAIAELEHDTPVQVAGCDGHWCHIIGPAGPGYVDQASLDLPRTLAPVPPANTDCVVVGQADSRGPIPTRFCSVTPSAPAAH